MTKTFFTPTDIEGAKEHVNSAGRDLDKTPYHRMMKGIAPIVVERMMIEVNGGTPLPDIIDDLARVAGWILAQGVGQTIANGAPPVVSAYVATRMLSLAISKAEGCLGQIEGMEGSTKIFSGTPMGEA